jgi:AcrR family transcriptional regulator
VTDPHTQHEAENLLHSPEHEDRTELHEDRSGLRAAILAAARELFNEQGYEATTMRKIAEHIGYSATAIYRHFPDKHSILTELVHGDFAALGASFAGAMAEPDPIERLGLLGRGYIDYGLRNPNHYRLMFMTRKTPVHALEGAECGPITKGDPTSDAYAALVFTLREVIATGVLRPEFSDPETVAQILWASLHGLVSLYLDHKGDEWVEWRPVRDLANQTLRMMMIGFARPEAHAQLMEAF